MACAYVDIYGTICDTYVSAYHMYQVSVYTPGVDGVKLGEIDELAQDKAIRGLREQVLRQRVHRQLRTHDLPQQSDHEKGIDSRVKSHSSRCPIATRRIYVAK